LANIVPTMTLVRHLSVPYSPLPNDMVEQRNQMVDGMSRSMMKAKKKPTEFWGEKLKSGSPWAMSELQLKRSLVQESSKKSVV